ncbi:PHP domain-containing protein [Thiohalobacter sp. IOR34]|uniref:PHP domain-containing protein n=1 Tax=Thiohalobacter sp. IOR34 TaxID=3057176 RepID=UPI0025B24903|nr:PHP domain-containing protein [Thiohalobacter sp. IOR34]WJW76647.1 PHP domain-containing protein [Thiohalobacter sp. IOR34]
MPVEYDLHSHSLASDGTLSPAALVARAAAAGVEVLALTDHDTTAGVAEARAAAMEQGIELVAGVEISVTWRRQTVHIVGLGVDPDDARLQSGLAGLCEFRAWRAEEIGRRLEKAGIADAWAGARRHARGVLISRTHFAHFLVEAGHAKSVRDVFKRYLVANRPGHVSGQWAALEDAVAWIRGAGGQAVVAHPARYRLSGTRLRQLLGEFRECGGVALEVVSGSHSTEEMHRMAGLARSLGLLASRGSDYHGPENPWIELGRVPALPTGCVPVWSDWPQGLPLVVNQ